MNVRDLALDTHPGSNWNLMLLSKSGPGETLIFIPVIE
jgi:hypothetical protein